MSLRLLPAKLGAKRGNPKREKQLKAGNRKKIALIEQKNPYCKDLYGSITD
ncbi:hypothetical protein XF24_00701 [candidate division SR1 bacterium Aalborg_AAW-1]|nr:hypothetical protein XF24_00701 [candidate division SR1 bacterium Aalborg_AAW-1]